MRTHAQRRTILALALKGELDARTAEFNLSPDEHLFYRREADRLLTAGISRATVFTSYDRLRRRRPFRPVVVLVLAVAGLSLAAADLMIRHANLDRKDTYPLFAAAATTMAILAATVGWGVASWVSYRNARVQHTMTLIFMRFAQPTFMQHTTSFVRHFGDEPTRLVTHAEMQRLTRSGKADELAAAQAVRYLLNYFELIAIGVIRGDLDLDIVQENFRGTICYFFDRCLPLIHEENRDNPRLMENLIQLRAHFREA